MAMNVKFGKGLEKLEWAIRPFVEMCLTRYDCTKLGTVRFVLTKNFSGLCVYPERANGQRGRILVSCSMRRSPWAVGSIRSWKKEYLGVAVARDGETEKTYSYLEGGGIIIVHRKRKDGRYSVYLRTPGRIDRIKLMEPVEDAVLYFGHELFHFLRYTRQVPGRNTENQADGFGIDLVREFRRRKKRERSRKNRMNT